MRLNLKWPVVFLVFLLTFASIYVANSWRQQHLVKEPLKETLLAIESVKSVDINSSKKNTKVLVTLNKAENISRTYKDIEESMLATYAEDSFKIVLVDNRNAYLESLYDKIHFALMEGERLGNYKEMNREISRILVQEEGLDSYRLWVDQKRIYLQLVSEDYYLFEIVPLIFSLEVGNA